MTDTMTGCRGIAIEGRLTVGSVKSCFGHTEGNAGLTGALLAMQRLSHQVRAAGKNHIAPALRAFEGVLAEFAEPTLHAEYCCCHCRPALPSCTCNL